MNYSFPCARCKNYKEELLLRQKIINSVQDKEKIFNKHIAEIEFQKSELNEERKLIQENFQQLSINFTELNKKYNDLQLNFKKNEDQLILVSLRNEELIKILHSEDKIICDGENLKHRAFNFSNKLVKELEDKKALDSKLSTTVKSLNKKKDKILVLKKEKKAITDKLEEIRNEYNKEIKLKEEKNSLEKINANKEKEYKENIEQLKKEIYNEKENCKKIVNNLKDEFSKKKKK